MYRSYPIFAKQDENPREATGRIVCPNSHLASKPVDIEVPQAADTVFEAILRIPYDMQLKQVRFDLFSIFMTHGRITRGNKSKFRCQIGKIFFYNQITSTLI
jgi:hypothetical protein